MLNTDIINIKNSLTLYGLDKYFDFLAKLYLANKIPKVLMLSGTKGVGKSTLTNHLMSFIFDKSNYNFKEKKINNKSFFYKQYSSDVFSNIIHLSGSMFKNIKIEDIRDLKIKLLKSTLSNKERFIILDDVELFNLNSLNALLKLIEEPSEKNYFILINNNSKPLIDTIRSRSLEVKINLSDTNRIKIIESLIKKHSLEAYVDYKIINLSPGNYLLFNHLINENKIDINNNFIINLELILNLYKKDKNITLINLIFFLADFYFLNLKKAGNFTIENIVENKDFVKNNINKFITYNLNPNTLMNAINQKLTND